MAGQDFLPGPSDAFHSFNKNFNKNEEYERRFYSNSYDSYLGSGFWQQIQQMASARQASLIASGESSYTNTSLLFLYRIRAENHELLKRKESRTCSVKKKIAGVKLSHGI